MDGSSINIADEMNGDTARIAIGDDLETGASITIGSGGMDRGMTIGWMDSATGLWNGDVTVAGQLLAPTPEYTQTGLGGGAVGAVPYGAHLRECNPAYTQAGPGAVSPGTGVKITIRHYGYVFYDGTGEPYEVFEAASSHCDGTCIHGALVDTTSEWTTIGIGPDTNSSGLRDMVLEGTVRSGKHYHVWVDGTLECWDVFGAPGTATKPYTFIFNTQ